MNPLYDDPYRLILGSRRVEDSCARAVVADLAAAGDDELRRTHRYLLERAWRWQGIERLRILYGPLQSVAEELRRRGLPAPGWTAEIGARSAAAAHPWLN